MTEIQINPEYKIVCTKNDDVEHWILRINNAFVIFLIPLVLIIALNQLVFPDKKIFQLSSCGIKIELYRGTSVCTEKEYRFTNNPEKDARNVKRIIDEFTLYGNNSFAENKEYQRRIEEEKQQCCNQYKEVMEKVKGK